MTTESTAINYKIGNERLISVTEKAARKLESLLDEKGKPEGALRLAVIGGGCSGLQYVMDLVEGPKERDILVPTSNVRLVVDPKSALFLLCLDLSNNVLLHPLHTLHHRLHHLLHFIECVLHHCRHLS